MIIKQEFLLDDENLKLRRKIIEEKRKKRQNKVPEKQISLEVLSSDSYVSLNEIIDNKNSVSDERLKKEIQEIEKYIKNCENNRKVTNYQQMSNELSVKPIFRHIQDYHSFNSLELNRLTELINALKVFKYSNCESKYATDIKTDQIFWTYVGQMFEVIAHNLVNFAKYLRPFDNLCDNDRIALIKYGCGEIIRSRIFQGNELQQGKYAVFHVSLLF